MLKYISIALLLLTLSCKSGEGSSRDVASYPEIQFIPKDTDNAREAAVVPAPVPSPTVPLVLVKPSLAGKECKPEDAPVCPPEEYNNHTRAVAVKYSGQLLPDHEQVIAFGDSPCKVKQALYKAACANNLNYANITEVTFHPDANEADCPATPEECERTTAPTRCFAEAYGEQELNLSNRPEAWGSNECDARNKLMTTACNIGLNPKELKTVRCEAEQSVIICPPIFENCVVQENEMTECRLSKIGEINLKQTIKGIGNSRCEATYRVQELACRFQKSPLKDLAAVECQGLGKPNPLIQSSVVPSEPVVRPAQ